MSDAAPQHPTPPEAAERRSPSSHTVHDAILAEGVEELARPSSALAWSALAGGLSMGFSLIAESLLQAALPDTPWRPLVSKLGYSVGFLIVILGRQQLFTENTLTPILPLLDKEESASLRDVLRLWSVVLVGNLLGAVAVAFVLIRTPLLAASVRETIASIGAVALAPGFGVVLLRGIFAGWLIALIVWLLPAAESGRIWVIVIITYVIGLGHFSHVIAGSIDVFALVAAGEAGWGEALLTFTLPSLLGNILGGVALVASINHAQVKSGGT